MSESITDILQDESERLYLRGFSTQQIASELGITIRRANRLLQPARKLMAEGGYARELAEMAAKGFTNLPTPGDAFTGKAGRPRKGFTAEQQAMRADWQTGKMRIIDLARKYGTYPQKVRVVLRRSPDLLA